ncbi:fibronectin type III domain-containing protein [Effusibacillus lacus]|uniref:Chitin-binding protein n=1 Tax=Effusibacillus lacus TaxID=1348429 RepID=A0A292YR33_9BACL|nr:fibronectin type III domain-containing protein [Effusibacillus lacus]TCS76118.1 fibronectin type III domain protein [Effusibacillus lacus]GAX91371.1 chitin-binding protein [Effusibacillus lacus]
MKASGNRKPKWITWMSVGLVSFFTANLAGLTIESVFIREIRANTVTGDVYSTPDEGGQIPSSPVDSTSTDPGQEPAAPTDPAPLPTAPTETPASEPPVPSDAAPVTTEPTAPPPDLIPPDPPVGFDAEPVTRATVIDLNWRSVADAVGYVLYRDGQQIADVPGGTFYSDTSVEPNNTYVYTLRAYDAAGNLSDPVSIRVESLDTIPPTVPAVIKGKAAAANQIHLVWSPSSDNRGVSHYNVYISREGNDFILIEVTDKTRFVHQGLGPGIQYQYKVQAVDTTGNESLFTRIVTIDTPDDRFNVASEPLPFSVSLQE